MSKDQQKQAAAEAALDFVESGSVVGVGSGSTVAFFIEALSDIRNRIEGAVSSSELSTRLLESHAIPVLDLNTVGQLPLYVDGADEAIRTLELIKGGGGALTREKIVAAASTSFVCIADCGKLVDRLGAFPLPIEVIPMAEAVVSRQVDALGGRPIRRERFTTDNGNIILDVHDLRIAAPPALESQLNDIPGVVTVGLFARRPADILLLGGPDGVETLRR